MACNPLTNASIATNNGSQNKMSIMLIGTNFLVYCLQRAQILYNFLAQKKANNNSRTIFSSAEQTYAHTHMQHKHTHTSGYETSTNPFYKKRGNQ